MRVVDLIAKKRDCERLSAEEISWLIDSYVHGEVPDYQMAAWAMAVVCRGMDDAETADLTLAMARSGEMLDLHAIAPITVDKHSTGGVGDKTSLVLGPMCAAIGLTVAKMSGRGLGFSGGTLDKLESIPGLRIDLDGEAFRRAVAEVGLVIAGQSADLAPADRQLYALRDVTGTVESIPLIAASIMSKKLAAGADCIMLDVKAGHGAFMETLDEARRLAQTMVRIGERAGRRTGAIISSMEQPLGYAIGNAVEVNEAIATLQGDGPADLAEVCISLGAELAVMAGRVQNSSQGGALLRATLEDGSAWEKFRQLVAHQNGSLDAIEAPGGLPLAPHREPIVAKLPGVVAAVDAREVAIAVGDLGGGRLRKGDAIDHGVGVLLRRKVGDRVAAGELLATVFARDAAAAARVSERVRSAFAIGDVDVAAPPLILEFIRWMKRQGRGVELENDADL